MVRLLGERFLWVDCLCIEQDDQFRKKDLIMQMDIVFSQAVMTLIALSGPNAAAPLPGVTTDSRRPSAAVETIGGHQVAALRSGLRVIMADSVYEERAWTFQEKLLSKRCLLFTHQQVFYYRHSQLRSDLPISVKCADINSLDFFKVIGLGETGLSVFTDSESAEELEALPGEHVYLNASELTGLNDYISIVDRYSGRKLSDTSDVLNGISGTLSLLQHHHQWEFIYGIPKEYIHFCLLWAPLNFDDDVCKRNTACSSWSRAGWTGQKLWEPMLCLRNFNYSNREYWNLASEIEMTETSAANSSDTTGRNLFNSVPISPQYTLGLGGATDSGLSADQDRLCFQAFVVSSSSFSLGDDNLSEKAHSYTVFTRLLDRQERRCGLIFELRRSPHMSGIDVRNCEFVLLSRYRRWKNDMMIPAPDIPTEGFPCTYSYICDLDAFPFSSWCLLNVMLIEWKGDRAERRAIGMIHEAAWENAKPVKKTIILQ